MVELLESRRNLALANGKKYGNWRTEFLPRKKLKKFKKA